MIGHELKKHGSIIQYGTPRGGLNEPPTQLSDLVSCPFCRKQCERLDSIGHGRHVECHMEEIAFVVVPKVYEEWKFYSESSSDRRFALRLDGYQCTVAHCLKAFNTRVDWALHEIKSHYMKAAWLCREVPGTTGCIPGCFELFFDELLYEGHLELVHSVDHLAIASKMSEISYCTDDDDDWTDDVNRWMDEYYPRQFWCGFCRSILDLLNGACLPWDYRFDHIASQHFELGQTMDSWRPPDADSVRRLGALDDFCV